MCKVKDERIKLMGYRSLVLEAGLVLRARDRARQFPKDEVAYLRGERNRSLRGVQPLDGVPHLA